MSIGLYARSLRIALVLAPVVITAYVLGLPFGPTGVAFAYSAAMALWLVPHVLWCIHGTVISPGDIFFAISRPLFAAVVAAICAFGVHWLIADWTTAPRVGVSAMTMMIVYTGCLLLGQGSNTLYMEVLRELRGAGLGFGMLFRNK